MLKNIIKKEKKSKNNVFADYTNCPLVSVIIPCYNSEKYIETAVHSIINQSYKKIEIIVTDDCSTDKSYEILKELEKIDRRIKVFRNIENLKIVNTLNNMVSLCNGKYIARMDADDISLPSRIEKEVIFLEKNPDIDIVGCNVIHIDEAGNKIRKTILPRTPEQVEKMKIFRTPFYHPAVMIRANVLKENKYDLNFLYTEDYELWLRILQKRKGANLGKRLLKYRIHNYQISKNQTFRQVSLLTLIFKKYYSDVFNQLEADSYGLYVGANIKDKKLFPILFRIILKTRIFKFPILFLTILRKFAGAKTQKC